MELKLNIPFNQLVELIRQLPTLQKQKLKQELFNEEVPNKDNSFRNFLLQGPVFSEEQITEMEKTHKSISKWRKEQF